MLRKLVMHIVFGSDSLVSVKIVDILHHVCPPRYILAAMVDEHMSLLSSLIFIALIFVCLL